jgi:hypothetical protein
MKRRYKDRFAGQDQAYHCEATMIVIPERFFHGKNCEEENRAKVLSLRLT